MNSISPLETNTSFNVLFFFFSFHFKKEEICAPKDANCWKKENAEKGKEFRNYFNRNFLKNKLN